PAHVIAEYGVGMPPLQTVLAFLTNCTIAMMNAFSVRMVLGDPPWFGSFEKTCTYIVLTSCISPAIVAFAGAFIPIVGGKPLDDFWIFYAHWFLANALPSLTLGPFLLIGLSDWSRWDIGSSTSWIPTRRHIEPTIMTLVLIGVCLSASHAIGAVIGSTFL